MSDAVDLTLPPQTEPDFTAEIARIDGTLATMAAESKAFRSSFDYNGLIAELDTLIPEDQRTEAPPNATDMDRVLHKITSALAAAKRPIVPTTDTSRPKLETPAEDVTSLPPHVRIARGYAA